MGYNPITKSDEIMDKIYLIHQWGTDYYKIGYTRGSVNKRLKTLQTGTPNELTVVSFYESDYAKLIESTFHRIYKPLKVNGEWFELPNNVVKNFISECSRVEKNFRALDEHNIFFQKERKSNKHLTKKFI